VASAKLAYTDPFQTGARPYVVLQLTGLNGRGGPVIGLIDSGADMTQLPIGYASLMGYGADQLEQITIGTAGSAAEAFRAKVPCTAVVVGIPQVSIDLKPVFSASSSYVLWGRTDFMATFGVTIMEKSQEFLVHWDDDSP
jgi:hypothetical protein